MTERRDSYPARTVARCETCGSVYVAKVSSDGSFCLDGLAECPCGDGDITLPDAPAGGIEQ